MLFVYFWNVNPDDSRLVGPFDDRETALAHIEDDESEDCAGIMELPFEVIRS